MDGNDLHIEIEKIRASLGAVLHVGNNLEESFIEGIYASDLMSDVLAYGKSGSILLTGLNTIQAAISAYMAEFKGIIFLRGKIPDSDTQKFALEKNLIVLSTEADMFEACVKLAGVESGRPQPKTDHISSHDKDNISTHDFQIDGQDFASAGMVSTKIKTILKSIGYDPKIIRRVAISTYEAEMNVVMHAKRADVKLTASDKEIRVLIQDEGKGIKDIEQAMKEGYSTATEEQRAMGFGAGMGLPNIKKNSDKMNIESEVDKGTKIETIFYII